MYEINQIKAKLQDCVKKSRNWANILKEDGNKWLASLITQMLEDYSEKENHWHEMLSKCQTIEELLIVWGYINYIRGLEESKEYKDTYYIR